MSGKICSGENLGYDPALDSIGRERLYPSNHHAMAASRKEHPGSAAKSSQGRES
jgi:hypothetical protein